MLRLSKPAWYSPFSVRRGSCRVSERTRWQSASMACSITALCPPLKYWSRSGSNISVLIAEYININSLYFFSISLKPCFIRDGNLKIISMAFCCQTNARSCIEIWECAMETRRFLACVYCFGLVEQLWFWRLNAACKRWFGSSVLLMMRDWRQC